MPDHPSSIEAQTEVLVIGGGVGGCLACIGARQQGAEVLVVEKGGAIARSGSAAGGIKNYSAFLGQGEWDTPEAYMEDLDRRPDALVNRRLAEVSARYSKPVFELLEGIGMPFRDPVTHQYVRIPSIEMASKAPNTVNFRGANFKPILASYVRQIGTKVLESVAIQGLLTRSGAVVGAVGLHVRTGQLHVLKAKAVVMTCGGAVRLFPGPAKTPYSTWACPYNTGDGHAMAFRAGAALANVEFTRNTLTPRGFGTPGLAAMAGYGAELVNSRGERYMERYHPLGMKAPRNFLVGATLQEMAAGRGPCYYDTRAVSPEGVAHIEDGARNEKPALLAYFADRGLRLGRDLVPLDFSEMAVRDGGVVTDERCAATLPGLFAAGECTPQRAGLGITCPLGYVAGLRAAEHAQATASLQEPDPAQVAELREVCLAPLDGGTVQPQELEEELRRVMGSYVGLERNEAGLKEAIGKLKALRQEARRLKAREPHDLLRANEARNLVETGLLVALAARERRESRLKPFHNRIDYPQRDDERWKGFVILERAGEDDVRVSFQPLTT